VTSREKIEVVIDVAIVDGRHIVRLLDPLFAGRRPDSDEDASEFPHVSLLQATGDQVCVSHRSSGKRAAFPSDGQSIPTANVHWTIEPSRCRKHRNDCVGRKQDEPVTLLGRYLVAILRKKAALDTRTRQVLGLASDSRTTLKHFCFGSIISRNIRCCRL
jgi:hypothetical protein